MLFFIGILISVFFNGHSTASRQHSGSSRYIGDLKPLMVVTYITLFLRSYVLFTSLYGMNFLRHFTRNSPRALSLFTNTFEKNCSRALSGFIGSWFMFTGTLMGVWVNSFQKPPMKLRNVTGTFLQLFEGNFSIFTKKKILFRNSAYTTHLFYIPTCNLPNSV